MSEEEYKNLRAILETSSDKLIYFEELFAGKGFSLDSVCKLLKETGYNISELKDKIEKLEYWENDITDTEDSITRLETELSRLETELSRFEEEKMKVKEFIRKMSFFRKEKNK